MRVKFWGVRGSIPCPGPNTVHYGGNTTCIEVRLDEIGRLLVIDSGTGIRDLGQKIVQERGDDPIHVDLFLTHTHWDHIMGLPFFAPMFDPRAHLTIHGPVTYEEETLKDVLRGQWTYRYFPIRIEELSSSLTYIDLKEGDYDLGQGLRVKTKYLNHPLLCLGYRFEFEGKVLCTAFDNEPFANLFALAPDHPEYDADAAREGEIAAREANQRIEAFLSGADLLIHDSQYTQAEYERSYRGWGHSSMEHAIDVAQRNQVKRLALFHHDVQRSDRQLDDLECSLRGTLADGLDIFFAREGLEISL